jgi:hypothetical protein
MLLLERGDTKNTSTSPKTDESLLRRVEALPFTLECVQPPAEDDINKSHFSSSDHLMPSLMLMPRAMRLLIQRMSERSEQRRLPLPSNQSLPADSQDQAVLADIRASDAHMDLACLHADKWVAGKVLG